MGLMDVRAASSPLDPGMGLTARRKDKEEPNTTCPPYANILGKLIFLAGMTRPDLSNSGRGLGRRAASPCMHHWRGLQYVLPYLTGTTNRGHPYPRGLRNDHSHLLAGYANSDWANDSVATGASLDTSCCSMDRLSS
ncbi:unnamed protein product, partial [Discosporangium mesarthrocarpum]